METAECSSVPYSLSDIKLPESPKQVLKCKEVKKDENRDNEPHSEKIEDKSTVSDHDTKSNGNSAPDALNSSHEEVSETETKQTRYSNDVPEKSNQRRDRKDSRQSEESSDVESDRNDNRYKKKSFSYDDTSSNTAARDSDESPSKERVSQCQKSRQQSDESDNEKSSDSEKYNHHLDSKRKSHGKHRKRNRRSRSSSSSSSRSSDSSPKRRHSKKVIVTKKENLTENDESNQMSDRNLDKVDDKYKGSKKDDSAIESTVASSVSFKKRLKIKRDNVPVEISSASKESSNKSVEKSSSLSTRDISPKQESTEVKEVLPEVPYTCRKVNLSNRKINRKSSEDKGNEPKSKKSKWESFAACQKTSNTISISTDSLKNWFPDFKLISDASSSMELETDEQSSSAIDEKNINIVNTDVSNGNDAIMRQESTSQIDIEDSESMEPNYEDTPEQGPVSKIIFIQNLVRPFTLNQLKELLKQSGKIVEEYFWIDKIKSKCFVMYESEKDAIKARNALNNTRWPSSNPKILSVEFSNEEELEQHKKGNEPPPPKPTVEPPVVEVPEVIEPRITHPVEEHKRKERERRKDRDRSKHQAPVREWDKDKIMQDSPEREHIPKEEKSRSSEKKEKKESKKRPNEDTPAKLLDDLFQKTKNPPCIYWLPLTEEQAKQKEEAKKMRKLEREKRNQQLKDQEAERRNRRARSNRRSREKENRKSSTRSRSPVSRRR